MLDHIHHLSEEEKNLVLQAPVYVSLLIAGADGHIQQEEQKRILELVHTKTFSEHYELRELYATLDHDLAEHLRQMMAALPEDTDERQAMLSGLLGRLNHIFPQLEKHFARRLYKNLREFAHYIAHADGGFWGISAVSDAEQQWIKLPMLEEPHTEEA
jgi:hypothetical protein